VVRYLLTLLSLFAVAVWLVLSYAPPGWVSLPMLALPAAWRQAAQGWLVVGLVGFLLVQSMILWATFRVRPATVGEPLAGGHRLRFAAELFWTALPLLMTVGLALLSYQTWRSLASS
jgi:heme/copper-type cytochrome/quinol oxidase subunit 2